MELDEADEMVSVSLIPHGWGKTVEHATSSTSTP
jgi:hypothetical protein